MNMTSELSALQFAVAEQPIAIRRMAAAYRYQAQVETLAAEYAATVAALNAEEEADAKPEDALDYLLTAPIKDAVIALIDMRTESEGR